LPLAGHADRACCIDHSHGGTNIPGWRVADVLGIAAPQRIALTDSGDDIQFWVPNHIVAAHKTR